MFTDYPLHYQTAFARKRIPSLFHTQAATSLAPALVIYLIDASSSMNDPCGKTTKIDLVNGALREAVQDMVRRSMSNGVIQPRYTVAIFAYSSKVLDLLSGWCDLADLVKSGLPTISADGETDTEAGFSAVETLLQQMRWVLGKESIDSVAAVAMRLCAHVAEKALP